MTSLDENQRHLNLLVSESIDEIIPALLGREVVDALYAYLGKVHSIPKSEVPYRLETLCSTLERILGPQGSRTIGRAVARRLFSKLGLTFINYPDRTLLRYVEDAKIKIRDQRGGQL